MASFHQACFYLKGVRLAQSTHRQGTCSLRLVRVLVILLSLPVLAFQALSLSNLSFLPKTRIPLVRILPFHILVEELPDA